MVGISQRRSCFQDQQNLYANTTANFMQTRNSLSSSKIVILLPPASFYQTIGKPFTELAETESTNNYAMHMAQNGLAGHGAAWFAHHQTAGKGQRGKSWKDEPGQNISLSVLLDTTVLPVSQPFLLSAAIAVAVHDFVDRYTCGNTSIKWPNDIYWRDRKAAGILIENSIRGHKWQWAVVGIGININQVKFDPLLANPVSLKQVTGKDYQVVELAKELCACIQQRYQQLIEQGTDEILNQYNTLLYKRDTYVQLKKQGQSFYCTIKNADAYGRLWVQDAMQPFFEFGEVEWVLNP